MGAPRAAIAASREEGQALLEFALVLPLLALLTFGTIEVGLYLQAQSSLNVTAFLGARAASTMGNDAGKAKQSIQEFTDVAGIGWLRQAGSQARSSGSNTSTVQLSAKVDRLTGMIGALTNGKVKDWKTITAQASLPLEYDGRTQGTGKSVTYKPETYRQISYENSYSLASVLTGRVSSITSATRTAGQYASQLATLLNKIASQPAPTPSAAPHPAGSPGTRPAPAPSPAVPAGQLQQWAKEASQLAQTINGISTTTEPFSTTTAIEANPLARGGAFSSGGLDSKVYLSPLYENTALSLPDYDIDTLVAGLKQSEQNIPTLYSSGQTVQTVKTSLASLQTVYPLLRPATAIITHVQAPIKSAVGTMAGDADKAYTQANNHEQHDLFPGTP